MSRRFSLTVDNLPSSATGDAFKTMLAIISDATTKRGRLISLEVGIADDSPQDLNLGVRINRTSNAGAGTPGTSPTPAKADPDGAASVMAAGRNYSAEPSTYEAEPVWQVEINTRNSYFKDFYNDNIRWRNQTLGLLIAPRSSSAVQFTCTLTWEED